MPKHHLTTSASSLTLILRRESVPTWGVPIDQSADWAIISWILNMECQFILIGIVHVQKIQKPKGLPQEKRTKSITHQPHKLLHTSPSSRIGCHCHRNRQRWIVRTHRSAGWTTTTECRRCTPQCRCRPRTGFAHTEGAALHKETDKRCWLTRSQNKHKCAFGTMCMNKRGRRLPNSGVVCHNAIAAQERGLRNTQTNARMVSWNTTYCLSLQCLCMNERESSTAKFWSCMPQCHCCPRMGFPHMEEVALQKYRRSIICVFSNNTLILRHEHHIHSFVATVIHVHKYMKKNDYRILALHATMLLSSKNGVCSHGRSGVTHDTDKQLSCPANNTYLRLEHHMLCFSPVHVHEQKRTTTNKFWCCMPQCHCRSRTGLAQHTSQCNNGVQKVVLCGKPTTMLKIPYVREVWVLLFAWINDRCESSYDLKEVSIHRGTLPIDEEDVNRSSGAQTKKLSRSWPTSSPHTLSKWMGYWRN